MRFCPNLSMLWKEADFTERFGRAKEAGFAAVEFWWPSGEDLDQVQSAIDDSGLEVALFNFDAGDMPNGDRGLVSDPDRKQEFRDNVPVALELARKVSCPRLNALVGLEIDGMDGEEQLELAKDNIAWAAEQAAEHGVEIMIEAVNTFENGPYLLSTTKAAADFVQEVGRDNVKLQYDAYHMQRMEGNVVATLREHIDGITHIQVADSPDRGEPGTGEMNYRYIFGVLDELPYRGWIGLEYKPTTESTEESLEWVPKEKRGQDVKVEDLRL
ncbi:MAG: TIM barrel protein [Actinomycetota bacterium]|nr:TIM barrel protein [Actinomycetota bacterium]